MHNTHSLPACIRNKIAASPLLTAAEEVALGREIRSARAEAWRAVRPEENPASLAAEDPDDDRLRDEVSVLRFRRRRKVARAALTRLDAACSRFEAANLRLALSVAALHLARRGAGCMTLGDLFGYAWLGLRTAVRRFDPERGIKFSTYATWWIRHKVGRSVGDLGKEIRVPINLAQRAGQVLRVREQHLAETGEDATPEQVADVLAMPLEKVRRSMEENMTQVVRPQTMNLRSAYGESDDWIPPWLADRDAPERIEDAVEQSERAAALARAVAALPDQRRKIVERCLGLGGEDARTAAVVADELGVSRQRVSAVLAESVRAVTDAVKEHVDVVRRRRPVELRRGEQAALAL